MLAHGNSRLRDMAMSQLDFKGPGGKAGAMAQLLEWSERAIGEQPGSAGIGVMTETIGGDRDKFLATLEKMNAAVGKYQDASAQQNYQIGTEVAQFVTEHPEAAAYGQTILTAVGAGTGADALGKLLGLTGHSGGRKGPGAVPKLGPGMVLDFLRQNAALVSGGLVAGGMTARMARLNDTSYQDPTAGVEVEQALAAQDLQVKGLEAEVRNWTTQFNELLDIPGDVAESMRADAQRKIDELQKQIQAAKDATKNLKRPDQARDARRSRG